MSDPLPVPDRPPDFVRLMAHEQCEEAFKAYIIKHNIVPIGEFLIRMLWKPSDDGELIVRLELYDTSK